MSGRIKQTSPCTREDLVFNDRDNLLTPHYTGCVFCVQFRIWKISDARFKNVRTYSLCSLVWHDIGKPIYTHRKAYGSRQQTWVHKLEYASDIYNLCFRKFMSRRINYRDNPIQRVSSKLRSKLEKSALRHYHDKRHKIVRRERREAMQEFYGKPMELISNREAKDYLFNTEDGMFTKSEQ